MDILNSPEVLALVPMIVGLTEAVKGLGITDRFAPLASICLGIALGFLVFPTLPAHRPAMVHYASLARRCRRQTTEAVARQR